MDAQIQWKLSSQLRHEKMDLQQNIKLTNNKTRNNALPMSKDFYMQASHSKNIRIVSINKMTTACHLLEKRSFT
jgi:hypothetical protein